MLIDTDGGVDDCAALWWVLAQPDVEVVGLVATWGNTERDQAAANLARVLHAAGHPGIPVALGVAEPSGPTPLARRAGHVHGADGLAGTAERWATGGLAPVVEPGPEMVARLTGDGEVDLVTLGPLTSLAAALEGDAGIVGRARSLTVMGGSIAAGGNALPLAEANVGQDPGAAAAVVAAGWRTEERPLLVGLDVTLAARLTLGDVAAARAADTAAGRFLAEPLAAYAAFYERVQQTPPGTLPCHDLLAVVAAAGRPVLTDVETCPLAVDVGAGAAWGATVADRRPVPQDVLPGFAPWRVALGVEPDAVHTAFRSLL